MKRIKPIKLKGDIICPTINLIASFRILVRVPPNLVTFPRILLEIM